MEFWIQIEQLFDEGKAWAWEAGDQNQGRIVVVLEDSLVAWVRLMSGRIFDWTVDAQEYQKVEEEGDR